MRSIYWKIFLWFWVTMILTVIGIAWFSFQFANQHYLPLSKRALITNYGVMAVITYQTGDKPALQRWLDELAHRSNTKAYLIDDKGQDVLARKLPEKIKDVVQDMLEGEISPQATRYGNIVISPIITAKNGKEFRFVSQKPVSIQPLQYIHFSGFLYGFVIALVITGIVCYLLSIYLMRPIALLKIAARKLGQGNLDVRVGNTLFKRRDEIGELAEEFDGMADKIQAMMAAQRRLLQDMSHELRTPLARLQIALELARKQVGNQAERELNRIELESERLNELIGQILSLARMSSAEYKMLFDIFDLVGEINSIINDIEYENPDEANRIELHMDNNCQFYGDRKLIRSAIENIIRNALRYTPKPKSIEVYLNHSDDDVNITIRDHGPGVSDEKLEQLFKAFYRVDDARTKQQGGYGLGLAIAKRAIALHEGSISASNADDSGLIINIDLSKNR